MNLRSQIERLLRVAMGLDPGSVGVSAIDRALHERQAASGAGSEIEYLALLRESREEMQELIEAVVVPETWFFRDREAFSTLAAALRTEWQPAGAQAGLRLLSLPCSTGEEPYSMAMALLDAGIPTNRFHIDAVDISVRALNLARRAIYRKNSFRGADLGFRDRHFEATEGGWRPSETVRRSVHFHPGNIFAPATLPAFDQYDAVFCRNMLIYFDRVAQYAAVEILERRLRLQGLLFVAAAETGLLAAHGFVPLRAPLAFAFRKQAMVPRSGAAPAPEAGTAVRAPAYAWPTPPAPAEAAVASPPVPIAAPEAAAAPGLEEAMRLADLGRLAEAGKICAAHLRQHGPSAQALYLMGLVCDAAGDLPEAVRYYRQTLYLEPTHQETLVHLALLLDKQGDHAGAELLRNRVKRRQRVGGA
jgi:chemotaxis protein methyltransferase WspC